MSASALVPSFNPNDPGTWSPPRQQLACAVAAALVLGLAWSLWLSDRLTAWSVSQSRESEMRVAYTQTLARVGALPALQSQKTQLEDEVHRLERQLPGAADLEEVMQDITRAGRSRGLVFELFKPGPPQLKTGHAELPVSIRVTGGYHDIGAFLGDLARLPRIVTLHALTLAPQANLASSDKAPVLGSRLLVLEGTLKAYRELTALEVAEVKRREAAAAKNAPPATATGAAR